MYYHARAPNYNTSATPSPPYLKQAILYGQFQGQDKEQDTRKGKCPYHICSAAYMVGTFPLAGVLLLILALKLSVQYSLFQVWRRWCSRSVVVWRACVIVHSARVSSLVPRNRAPVQFASGGW